MSKFVKFTIWFVAILLVLLGVIYFSYNENRSFLKMNNEALQMEADQLLKDNEALLDTSLDSGFAQVRPLAENDHLWGRADAPVQLIVYTDYDCPFCADYHQTLKQVRDEFGDR